MATSLNPDREGGQLLATLLNPDREGGQLLATLLNPDREGGSYVRHAPRRSRLGLVAGLAHDDRYEKPAGVIAHADPFDQFDDHIDGLGGVCTGRGHELEIVLCAGLG